MHKKAEEYIRAVAEVYGLLLFVLLPLYMRNGYALIGDVKYQFFRNATVMFCILLSLLQLVWVISGREKTRLRKAFSLTDALMLGYLASAVLSCCLGMERHTALWGFSEWHMGLFSQMLFVWIYFVLSRWTGDAEKMGRACFWGALAVMALAILNRYGFDPLGAFREMTQGTWDMEHLLSTIGNQNWYCGYVSVAASACFYFGYLGEGAMGAAGLCGCLISFWTIMTQGSESGYLIPLAVMAVLLADALGSRRRLLRFCLVSLCWPAAALPGVWGIRFRGLILVEDGSLGGVLFWRGWPLLFLLLGGASLTLYVREKRGRADLLESGRIKRAVLIAAGILTAAGMVLFLLCQLSDGVWDALGGGSLLRLTDGWGSGRGALWRMCLEYFAQCPWVRKLFGAGPDCFYYALYSTHAVNDVIHPTGQWETAVYANAHNEWLNMLINQGILGLFCYAGIFIASFIRLWRIRSRKKQAYWGILAVAGYCVHSTVSFQQVVSAPLVFAILGISEALLRSEGEE